LNHLILDEWVPIHKFISVVVVKEDILVEFCSKIPPELLSIPFDCPVSLEG